MRIHCPFCGAREPRSSSISATPPLASATRMRRTPQCFYDYVYLRDNPAGPHHELWYHAAGCQTWLVVERDTRTHEISSV